MNEEFEVIKEMFAIAKEFSEHENNYIYELSHYLSDNIITKIAIAIAKKYNLQYKKKTKAGDIRTLDFQDLYENILQNKFPSLPNYKPTISQLHNDRNIYQHREESLRLGIRKEIAQKYIEIVQTILIEANIIKKKSHIKSTALLKKKVESFEENFKQIEEAAKNKDFKFIKRKIPGLIDKFPQQYELRIYSALLNLRHFLTVSTKNAKNKALFVCGEDWNMYFNNYIKNIKNMEQLKQTFHTTFPLFIYLYIFSGRDKIINQKIEEYLDYIFGYFINLDFKNILNFVEQIYEKYKKDLEKNHKDVINFYRAVYYFFFESLTKVENLLNKIVNIEKVDKEKDYRPYDFTIKFDFYNYKIGYFFALFIIIIEVRKNKQPPLKMLKEFFNKMKLKRICPDNEEGLEVLTEMIEYIFKKLIDFKATENVWNLDLSTLKSQCEVYFNKLRDFIFQRPYID